VVRSSAHHSGRAVARGLSAEQTRELRAVLRSCAQRELALTLLSEARRFFDAHTLSTALGASRARRTAARAYIEDVRRRLTAVRALVDAPAGKDVPPELPRLSRAAFARANLEASLTTVEHLLSKLEPRYVPPPSHRGQRSINRQQLEVHVGHICAQCGISGRHMGRILLVVAYPAHSRPFRVKANSLRWLRWGYRLPPPSPQDLVGAQLVKARLEGREFSAEEVDALRRQLRDLSSSSKL
jgi:hypothetical protein